jgi:hexokinase
MDAGGTNFRVATVYFDRDRNPIICKENGEPLGEQEKLEPYEMPGVKEEVSKKEFFNIIAGYMKNVVHASEHIGFCFSYPIEMFPNKDGRVLYFSKEIRAEEVNGQMIGENLNLAIQASGQGHKKQIVLLNDTVTALLAGRSSFPNRTFDSYVGFILGTGTNCCYIEHNSNITKNKDLDPRKSQIVNVESGGFARAPRGTIDQEFDESSVSPGTYTFEKMISGAYLGPLCLKTINVAAREGLLSAATMQKLKDIPEISTKQISNFMYYSEGRQNAISSVFNSSSEQDLITSYYLIDRLIERAAKLTAINLSAVAIKSGKGTNPCHPICIVAEGTTFYRLRSLKQRVEYYLKQYLEDQKNIYCEIVNVENATLIGAAIAGLTN